jgi:DNA-directed RNA polymerase specialized sigma24 family protein
VPALGGRVVSAAEAEGLTWRAAPADVEDELVRPAAAAACSKRGSGKSGARQAQVIEMRYFGGLTIDEVSALLGVSAATISRGSGRPRPGSAT